MLPSVTQTATMIAKANTLDTIRARFMTSALVVCGCMALVYQIVTFTRAFRSQVQKINQLFFAPFTSDRYGDD